MNNLKPIQTINEFIGMGDNNLVYNSGFLPEKINGKSIMTSGLITKNLTGYKDITSIDADFTSFVNLSSVNINRDYIIAVGKNGKFYTTSNAGTEALHIKKSLIHDTGYVSDIFELDNNNIIYSQNNDLGYGVRGSATGGSTTTIIDTTRHFGGVDKGVYDNATTYAQYDYVSYEEVYYACILATTGNLPTNETYWIETIPNTIAVGDFVTNLKNGEEEEITSITTTTNQNDTLNFDTTTATEAGDEYIAWEDDKFDLTDGVDVKNWQDTTSFWKRQIKQYGDEYIILNGNYLAMLSEELIDTTYKQLPARNQALCFEVNNSSILVSAEHKGKGKLLLWDGNSDGWNNSLDFDYPVTALVNYFSGWLFVSRGTLYYTNGYSIEEMTTLDIGIGNNYKYAGYLEPEHFNGLYYFDNKLYFANSYTDNNLIDYGIFCFDFKMGWIFIEQDAGYAYKFGRTPVYSIGYATYGRGLISLGENTINEIKSHETYTYSYSNGRVYYSFIYYLNFLQETTINGVGLNLLRPIKSYLEDDAIKKTSVTVNMGDDKRGLIDYIRITEASGSSNKLKVDGTSYTNNKVGDEIVILDNDDDEDTYFRGTRKYITAIENAGLSTEIWTLNENLISSFTGYIKIIRVKKLDNKEVSSNELNEEVKFFPKTAVYSNKIFIEVVIEDDDINPMPISISNIKIY